MNLGNFSEPLWEGVLQQKNRQVYHIQCFKALLKRAGFLGASRFATITWNNPKELEKPCITKGLATCQSLGARFSHVTRCLWWTPASPPSLPTSTADPAKVLPCRTGTGLSADKIFGRLAQKPGWHNSVYRGWKTPVQPMYFRPFFFRGL